MPGIKTTAGELVVVTLLFVVLAAAATWPLVLHLDDRSLAGPGHNDVRFNIWVMYWGAHALTTDPLHLHQANIFYPEPWTFAYSDIELSNSLLMLPVIAFTDRPELVYSLLVLFSLVIGGLGFYLFARRMTDSRVAAVAGAAIFLFNPARFGRYLQIQFFADHWLPLFFWALAVWLEILSGREQSKHGLRWALLAAFFFTLHALSGSHNAVFGTLLALFFVLWRLFRDRLWRLPAFWRDGALAAFLAGLILVPVFYPYLIVEKKLASGRVESSAALESGSADANELLSAGTPFYRWLDDRAGWPGKLFDHGPRGYLFIGFVPLLLAGLGLFRGKTKSEDRPPAGRRAFPVWILDVALIITAWLAVVGALSGSRGLITPFGPFPLPPTWALAIAGLVLAVARLVLGRGVPHIITVAATAIVHRFRPVGDQWLWIGVLVFAVWASLGPGGMLYQGLSGLPLVKLIRVPRRFMLIASFAVAVLSIQGVASLAQRLRGAGKRIGIAMLLTGFFAVESCYAPLRLYEIPETPAVYRWLAAQPGDFTVMEFPLDPHGWAQHMRQVYGSIHHWKRLVVGYSGYQSPENVALLTRLNEGFPSDACMDSLQELRVRYVLVFIERLDAAQLAALARQTRLVEEKRFGMLTVYRLTPRQDGR